MLLLYVGQVARALHEKNVWLRFLDLQGKGSDLVEVLDFCVLFCVVEYLRRFIQLALIGELDLDASVEKLGLSGGLLVRDWAQILLGPSLR